LPEDEHIDIDDDDDDDDEGNGRFSKCCWNLFVAVVVFTGLAISGFVYVHIYC